MDIDIDQIKKKYPNSDIEIDVGNTPLYESISVAVMNVSFIAVIAYVALKVTPWALLALALGGASTNEPVKIKVKNKEHE